MSLPIFETTLNILREAGFVLQVRNEIAEINGVALTTAYPNIISNSVDTAVADTASVEVLVNGVAAEVSAINAKAGRIELTTAPTPTDSVVVSYYYSPIDIDYVNTNRDDVECMIVEKMRGVDSCVPYEAAVPNCIRMITRIWTAGMLLAKDYGYNTDTENTSKDGYKKMEYAKSLLDEYYKNGGACKGMLNSANLDVYGGSGDILSKSCGNLFERRKCAPKCEDSDAYFDRW